MSSDTALLDKSNTDKKEIKFEEKPISSENRVGTCPKSRKNRATKHMSHTRHPRNNRNGGNDEVVEERLIHKCRGGDGEACAELLKKYASLIYSVPLHSFGMSQEDADDIYQICFMRVLSRANQFRGDSRFSAWLRTVVRNICVDCIRSQKSAVSLEVIREGCEKCPLSCVCNVDSMVKQAEERSILEQALSKLPDHYRNPIRLFFFEQKSYKEISQILDEPVNTVGTHINRGLARLRKQLGTDAETVEALLK